MTLLIPPVLLAMVSYDCSMSYPMNVKGSFNKFHTMCMDYLMNIPYGGKLKIWRICCKNIAIWRKKICKFCPFSDQNMKTT